MDDRYHQLRQSCGSSLGEGTEGALASITVDADWPTRLAESEHDSVVFAASSPRIRATAGHAGRVKAQLKALVSTIAEARGEFARFEIYLQGIF
jgi:hypothetical protein